MKRNRMDWGDFVIILGMVVVVLLLCQPVGRDWDEKTSRLYTGTEGVYASDPDTYYYLRKTREIAESSDVFVSAFSDSKDSLRTSGSKTKSSRMPVLLSVIMVWVWRFFRLLGINVGVYQIAIVGASFILALCTIPIYIFLRKRISRCASIMGAVFLVLAKPYFSHSWKGVLDTDSLVCLCGLTMILALWESYLCETKKQQLVFSAIYLLMVSLMYMSWASYYLYVFIALSITVAGMLVCEVCFRKNSRKRNRFVAPLLCIVMSIGFVALFSWKDMVSLVGGFIRKGENSGLWPNPNTQISELQSVKIFSGQSFWELFVQHRNDFLSYVGGIIPLLFFVVSVVVLLYMAGKGIKGKKWRVQETRELVFLYVSGGSWLIGSFVLLFWGIRFFEFFIMPMAIVLAFGMNVVLEKIPTRRLVYVILSALSFAVLVSILPIWAVVLASFLVCLGFWLGRSKRRTVLAITIVAVVLLPELELSIVKSTHAEPFVNRPIEEALIWIKECTPEDAVLINDWSLGYAYQYYSERRTISDGGFYSGGFLFWAYTMLITDDEKLSAGIAKMLTGDWEEGTEYVVSLCGDTKTAVALMKELLSKTKVEATDYLNRNTEFSKDQKEMMLSYTHPESNPDLYLVLESNMITRSPVLQSVAEWSFEEGVESKTGITLVSTHSVARPVGDQIVECDLVAGTVIEGWKVRLKEENGGIVGWVVQPNGEKVECIRVVNEKDGERIFDKQYSDTNSEEFWGCRESLLVIDEGSFLSVIVCDEKLLDSLLFRLFVYEDRSIGGFFKVKEGAISKEDARDNSSIQCRLGTIETQRYRNSGISIWKIR